MTTRAARLNKLVTYGLLIVAILILAANRFSGTLKGDDWTAAGLLLFGLSCFTDPLLPGGTELTPQQKAMIRHARIPYRDGAEKVVSLVVGIGAVAGGLYFILR